MEQRFDTLFSAFDSKAPSQDTRKKILGNLDRAGGSLLDQTQYTDNEPVTEDAMNQAIEFCQNSKWEAEEHDFTGKKMVRFVTKDAVTTRDVRKLVNFLAGNQEFKDKIYHVHTGAHCT